MKTMSVYGLLGKIYNCNDDLPKRILFRDRIYELDDYNHYVYKEIDGKYGRYIDLFDETSSWELDDFLREQVEIIENDETEEKKIPEKLDVLIEIKSKDKIGALTNEVSEIQRRFNQLIDYFKSKGE